MATYENLDYGSPDGSIWGKTASDKIGVYGAVPVVQRAFSSAVHRTTGFVTSASVGPTQAATVNEIQNTLIGLGIWATAS
jgi:hypothetical protein